MKKFLTVLCVTLLAMIAGGFDASAQFKSEAFSQNYDNQQEVGAQRDTSSMFSLKMYFRGLSHKSEMKLSTMAIGSAVFVGGGQIYNRDYWKLPIIYTGLAGTIGYGIIARNQGHRKTSNWMFAAAGAVYWGTMMDAVVNFPSELHPDPAKSAMYSLLCPGLGQIYNGEAWKVPVYWGLILGAWHFYDTNSTNYKRFRNIYLDATNPDVQYDGPVSAETALYYRNVYRRYRDYSTAAMVLFYLLQVIDANVFAFMQDFKVSDDISMSVQPTIVSTDNQYALSQPSGGGGLGLSVGLRF